VGYEDEAMFTRRPLGGMSCASCEKDITGVYGKKADYVPWGRLPSRDPSERIARVRSFCQLLIHYGIGRERIFKDVVNGEP
jgi:hypothetical protein